MELIRFEGLRASANGCVGTLPRVFLLLPAHQKTKPLPTPSKSADVYDGRRLRFVDLAALASSQHVIARNEVIYASMDRLWKLGFIP